MKRTFFFDECVSCRVAKALSLLDRTCHVSYIGDGKEFDRGAEDPDWIPYIAQRKWILVSEDIGQTKNALLSRLIRDGGLHAYYLEPGLLKPRHWPSLLGFFRLWPKLRKHALENNAPGTWKVSIRSPRFRRI